MLLVAGAYCRGKHTTAFLLLDLLLLLVVGSRSFAREVKFLLYCNVALLSIYIYYVYTTVVVVYRRYIVPSYN